jgi:two-component system, NarL family, nitrate/nitrite response regulator NarL
MTAQTVDFPATATSRADGRAGSAEPAVPTALICDNSLLRSGLQHILTGTPFVIVEGSPATGSRLISGVVQEPALVILAVSQPSSHTPEMVRQVKERHPTARIVVLAEHLNPEFLRQALEAGVSGFCLTGSSREVLIISLELVMLGESVLVGPVARLVLEGTALSPEPKPPCEVADAPKASDPGIQRLSAREAEILSSLMEGAPNKIIARKLDVAEATVKVHIKAILRKIGVTNRTQAAMWAMNHIPARAESSLHEA